ncbi:phosphonoacetaldehyde reductase [Desulfofustis limnaeus]|uniref:1,3-propanediol dehydrogenase n=1 Tax=Desulfofustis limnaeus TaxID=2740163 RepID=A0ABM7W7C2_9BACT|nr:phosphonoacetaldehyde reductase [Desulfofustis limnaeus]BDD86886.1 1,3-propanediol dehydrogenase [Desulfofustis limnaeus]
MDLWSDYNPVRITAGPGAINRLFSLHPSIITGKRILLVTSAGFTARGVTEKIEAKARKAGLKKPLLVLDGVTANPELDFLERLTGSLRSEDITGIIALGGGSALDTAKVLSVTIPSNLEMPLDMVLRQKQPYVWKNRIPVIAIPTTAGTGAEATPFATVWDRKNKTKYSVSGEMVYPVHALLDPELTLTLPPKETLYSGLDAISHALESLWNKNLTPVSEALALKALSLANEALPEVIKQPNNLHSREMMQQAALMAGLAISRTRTAIAHAISYPVTMRFGVPHGLACSFTLPGIIKHYSRPLDQSTIKTVMLETLKTIDVLRLDNEMTTYIGENNLSEYIEEMLHHDRASNYSGIMTGDDISRLILLKQ